MTNSFDVLLSETDSSFELPALHSASVSASASVNSALHFPPIPSMTESRPADLQSLEPNGRDPCVNRQINQREHSPLSLGDTLAKITAELAELRQRNEYLEKIASEYSIQLEKSNHQIAKLVQSNEEKDNILAAIYVKSPRAAGNTPVKVPDVISPSPANRDPLNLLNPSTSGTKQSSPMPSPRLVENASTNSTVKKPAAKRRRTKQVTNVSLSSFELSDLVFEESCEPQPPPSSSQAGKNAFDGHLEDPAQLESQGTANIPKTRPHLPSRSWTKDSGPKSTKPSSRRKSLSTASLPHPRVLACTPMTSKASVVSSTTLTRKRSSSPHTRSTRTVKWWSSSVELMIQDKVPSAHRVYRMTKGDRTWSLVTVYLDASDPNSRAIDNLRSLGGTSVRVEEKRKSNDIPQCRRCQKFNHTVSYCRAAFVCGFCSANHATATCPKKDTTQATPRCANCNGEHRAFYRGCPEIPHKGAHAPKKGTPPPPPFVKPNLRSTAHGSSTTRPGMSYANAASS
ncbi:uncharacterized protein LOC111643885 [Copidosoma floridanum]|uniref:uncharacterized protein LOC111643885 n=1 Tax=Copidosoma floridanum TaxID=29053 RepID=UPI000C6FADED|nr:uncharacterized protein LOC111643885 [Copidosoma floridanum]